ncbi:GDSL esterase/lipase [Spatholobus suberectus]|nr:GDSL esterase/lipase [Spatholobus suberectus]
MSYNLIWVHTIYNHGSCVSSFTIADASCCLVGVNRLCAPNQTPCQNRTAYGFWDEFHPTEAVSHIIALSSYDGSNPDLNYPMDIKRLVQS